MLLYTSLSTKPFEIGQMALGTHDCNGLGSLCYAAQDFEDVIALLHSGKLKIPCFNTRKIFLDDLAPGRILSWAAIQSDKGGRNIPFVHIMLQSIYVPLKNAVLGGVSSLVDLDK